MTHNPDQISSDNTWAAGRDAKLLDNVIAERDRLRGLCAAYKGQVEAGAGEIERLRAALLIAFNRMPTYAFDVDGLKKDRRVVQDALGIGDALCVVHQ